MRSRNLSIYANMVCNDVVFSLVVADFSALATWLLAAYSIVMIGQNVYAAKIIIDGRSVARIRG